MSKQTPARVFVAALFFVVFLVVAAVAHYSHHDHKGTPQYKEPTEFTTPANTNAPDTLPDSVPATPAPATEHPNEGDPGWDCHTMGNRICGPTN